MKASPIRSLLGKDWKSDLRNTRTTVESVYVAIILAFVLRAFMVEAFVIPTGSMANSLYGQHYTLTCPCCQRQYAFGYSTDDPGSDGVSRGPRPQDRYVPSSAVCPNCHFPYATASPHMPRLDRHVVSRSGDRVLVMKYIYDFHSPQPWDVVVFKNPQNNRQNYIKRLIGLPGETIEIVRGDIFVSHDDGKTFKIRRKPSTAQKALWQIVYDNDYYPDPQLVRDAGIDPPAWGQGADPELWSQPQQYGGRVWAFAGGDQPAKLDFRPGSGGFLPTNGYNHRKAEINSLQDRRDLCTDWRLDIVWKRREPGEAALRLYFESFSDRFCGEFFSDGRVRLKHQKRDEQESWDDWGETQVEPFEPGDGRKVSLVTVDFRAELWVDDECVLASSDEQWPGDYRTAKRRGELRQLVDEAAPRDRARLEKEIDWADRPRVYLTAEGGKAQLWHLKLRRDVYYSSPELQQMPSRLPEFQYARWLQDHPEKWKPRHPYWRTPMPGRPGWGTMGYPIHLADRENDDLDEFFCLGDNSTQSHDGRSWLAAAPSLRLWKNPGEEDYPIYQLGTVPRYNLLGKGFMVYWPAGFRLPVLNVPIVPDVGRMRLIR